MLNLGFPSYSYFSSLCCLISQQSYLLNSLSSEICGSRLRYLDRCGRSHSCKNRFIRGHSKICTHVSDVTLPVMLY